MTVDDQATAVEERDRALALRYHRRPEGPASVGYCLCCREALPAARRWCDADCRDDWERERRAS